MENDEQNRAEATPPHQTVYPTPTTGLLADAKPMAEFSAASAQTVEQPTNFLNTSSLVMFGLLILTFFSPLGPALFLPIVLFGLLGAGVATTKKATTSAVRHEGPKGVAFNIFRAILILAGVIAIGFVGLIGLIFILIATGAGGEFRMGS